MECNKAELWIGFLYSKQPYSSYVHPKLTVFARAVSRPTRPREAIAWEPELVVATAALHRLKLQTHVGCLLQVVETAPAMAETAAGAPNDNDHHLFFNGMLLRITTATTAAGVGATDAAVRGTADALLRWSGLLFDPAHIPTLTLTLAPLEVGPPPLSAGATTTPCYQCFCWTCTCAFICREHAASAASSTALDTRHGHTSIGI